MTRQPPIRGLGTDLIEIDRVRKGIERHGVHFLDRLFTRKEQDYCYRFHDPVPHFAGRFAAKEAIVKALGTGFGADVGWHDLEILANDRGAPIVFVSAHLTARFENPSFLISISHAHTFALATAIWY